MSLIKHGRSRDFIEQMEGLINLCSSKHIKVVPGRKPCTNGVDTIELPWIAEDATEEDFLSFFCYAAHEQSHFYGKTDVKLMNELADKYKPLGKMFFSCINTMDDIRCENLQEKEYPGLKQYRITENDLLLDKHFKEAFATATTKNIGAFIHNLQCYVIFKMRALQLGVSSTVEPSEELAEAYKKYVSDLEEMILEQNKFRDAIDLAEVFFNRIRDLVKDEESEGGESGEGGGSGEEGEGGESSDDGEKGEEGEEKGKPTDEGDSEGEGSDGEGSDDDSESGGEPGKGKGSKKEETDEEREAREAEEERKRKKAEEERKRRIEEALKDAEEEMGTLTDEITKHIMELADEAEAPYMVDPHVKDIIEYNREGSQCEADQIKSQGLKILGLSGSKLTRLFVGNSRPRPIRNQRRGRFDMRSFMADPMDRRFDVYSDTLAATVDKAAVSIMMDNSGSMGGVIQKAYAILSGLMHHLCRANIPTEVVGFTTKGSADSETHRDCPLKLTIVKKFEDPYDGKAMRRCVVPHGLDQNAEVDCLRYMVPRLWRRPEKKKILFIVGDGDPCIGNYNLNMKLSKAYDTYLNLCRELGIVVFGFGINCDLSRFFKEDYVNVTSSTMGPEIVKKLTDVLNRKKRA